MRTFREQNAVSVIVVHVLQRCSSERVIYEAIGDESVETIVNCIQIYTFHTRYYHNIVSARTFKCNAIKPGDLYSRAARWCVCVFGLLD